MVGDYAPITPQTGVSHDVAVIFGDGFAVEDGYVFDLSWGDHIISTIRCCLVWACWWRWAKRPFLSVLRLAAVCLSPLAMAAA